MIGHDDRVNGPKIPQYHELMWPALQATKELGGSATVSEMNERAMAAAGITEEQQAVPHGEDGRMSEVEYRLHWARTYLKGIGALENSARGVWAVTDRGRSMSEPEMRAATKAWRDSYRERRLARRASQAAGAEGGEEEAEAEGDWKDQLIARLHAAAAGWVRAPGAAHPARSRIRECHRDGQERRWRHRWRGHLPSVAGVVPGVLPVQAVQGGVTPGVVRDFRGAMAGRGEKGLLITTGSFTRDAQAEATRDGAPPVELIDGDRLCDLLKEFRLGVEVRERITGGRDCESWLL